jgi:hypothetical protein
MVGDQFNKGHVNSADISLTSEIKRGVNHPNEMKR